LKISTDYWRTTGNFVLSFTGTRLLAELESSEKHEILRVASIAKDFKENSVSRIEVKSISMRALFLGFLVIALGLSIFRRGRK
jgi:hypothetical protein